jgi:tetratricopeptide (TPR) repeat protein
VSKKVATRSGDQKTGTLMKRIVANSNISLNSAEYKVAMDRYRENMSDILKKFSKNNIPVFFSEVVSNINDIKPFGSEAINESESADSVFEKAQLEEKKGEFEKAKELYTLAKDLDVVRFRASEEVNQIINELAAEYKAVKVPMQSVFQNNSPHNLIGNNLMTEHVHPNIDGAFLMADAFFKAIIKNEIIGQVDTHKLYSNEYYKINWGYTSLDSLVCKHRVESLKGFWPFKREGEEEYFYIDIYQPKSFLDSVALSVVKNSDLSLSELRLDLAEKYEKSGQIKEAYHEYEALLCTNPYLAINYRDAANCLLILMDLPKALRYYQKSLEYEDEFFANFRIGEIYLLMGNYEEAISIFRKTFDLAPDDKKVNILTKTYIAYKYSNKEEEAKAVEAELRRVNKKLNLNLPEKNYFFDRYIPFQTVNEVKKAKELVNQNKLDEALELLEHSLNIYDSHIANRLIGDIYFQKSEIDKALEYYNKVYNYFRFDPKFLNQLVLIYRIKGDNENVKKYMNQLQKNAIVTYYLL